MIKHFFLFCFFLLFIANLNAQNRRFSGHSHNDYYQERPFHLAYENYFASIEVDIWAIDDQLFVAHDREEITKKNTLRKMYIDPIIKVYQENKGKPWKNYNNTFILLVDLKTSYDPALDLLVDILKKYPDVFDPSVNPFAVRVVVSGNGPQPELYHDYPSFISFDGRIEKSYTVGQLQRVPLFSNNFRDFSQWEGNGTMPPDDRRLMEEYVKQVHDIGKKVRFWAIPDNPNGWEQFSELNVDLINTDKPSEYMKHFNDN
ncbi:MAG: phosphatidylinositol-specific phospholipase C/glycerophosphodiester phosphodiesterase family protein [Bacteroidota bacterium]